MKESLQSNEDGDTENGDSVSDDIHSIHNLPDCVSPAFNEEVAKMFGEILTLQGLVISKINDIKTKKI
jgi:hypothetical protein